MKTFITWSVFACLPLMGNAQNLDLSGLPAALTEKVTMARKTCANFENGKFSLEWGAVTRTDLDGDGYPDWVIDESAYACSTAASLFCGTGGCISHFLVDDTVSSFLNQGWTVFTFGQHRILLTDEHGSKCGGVGPTPCFFARTWDREKRKWRTAK